MSCCLVMEGGGMRGLFTAGVIDVLLESGVCFDAAVGVSAGAIFGTNIKSGQAGRVLRFNLRFCRDPRYVSLRSLIRTGDVFGADFCYNQLTYHLDPFDTDAFARSPMKFYAVCTDLRTGKPYYHLCEKGTPEDMIYIRASASMPLVSRTVIIGGAAYLDGGVADPLPVRFAQGLGYERMVVIRTKPEDYKKSPQKGMFLARARYRDYPEFVKTFARRHEIYNDSLEDIRSLQKQGRAFVIAPQTMPPAGVVERNPDRLRRTHEAGREEALRQLDALRRFMQS